jgi:hypothetical protein
MQIKHPQLNDLCNEPQCMLGIYMPEVHCISRGTGPLGHGPSPMHFACTWRSSIRGWRGSCLDIHWGIVIMEGTRNLTSTKSMRLQSGGELCQNEGMEGGLVCKRLLSCNKPSTGDSRRLRLYVLGCRRVYRYHGGHYCNLVA